MKKTWKTVVSLCWVATVYAFFLRQYAEKVLSAFGM